MNNLIPSELQPTLLYLYQISDLCPVASSISNLTILFQKFAFRGMDESSSTENKSRYFSYVKNKPLWQCFILLIPVLGNIAVFIYSKIQAKKLDSAINKKCEELETRLEDVNNAVDQYRDFLACRIPPGCIWGSISIQQADYYWLALLRLATDNPSKTQGEFARQISANTSVLALEKTLAEKTNELLQLRFDSYKNAILQLDKRAFMVEAASKWLFSFDKERRPEQAEYLKNIKAFDLHQLLKKRYESLAGNPVHALELKAILECCSTLHP